MPARAPLALAATLVALAAATSPAAAAQTVKVPSGDYTGTPHKVFMRVSGKSIDVIAFTFRCKATHGRTSLDSIPLKRTDAGYRFSIDAHASVSYMDGHPDQNGTASVSGQFTRSGKSATGKFQVITRRCGTGHLDWDAQRISTASR